MSETVRIVGMREEGKVLTQKMLGSAFSEFQPFMWQEYGILGLDSCYGKEAGGLLDIEERLMEFGMNNLADNKGDLLEMEITSVGVDSYGLLTDANGWYLKQQAIRAAKEEMSKECIDDWIGKVINNEKGERTMGDIEADIEKAEVSLQQPSEKQDNEAPLETEIDMSKVDHPFEVFKVMKEKGWLGLIIGDKALSNKVINIESAVSHRELNQGTKQIGDDEISIADKALYEWHLTKHFRNYCNPQENHCLDYELEYLVAGKESDRENLESVILRLLAVRVGANATTILRNPQMIRQAREFSASIASVSGNTAMIPIVQSAVILVWALVEGILDMRALLSGKKVAVLKSVKDWTSNLYTMAIYVSNMEEAKDNAKGLSYDHYLAMFLTMISSKDIGLRPLDLIEATTRMNEEYVNMRADNMIVDINIGVVYRSQPLFASVNDLHQFYVEKNINY